MTRVKVVLIICSLLFSSGCQYSGLVSLFGTPSQHENDIPAEYDLTEHSESKILVLVNQPAWLSVDVNLRYYLTRLINRNLTARAKVVADNLVSYSRLSDFRSSRADFPILSPVEVGAALEVDLVLVVDVSSYELVLMDEMGYYRGDLGTECMLLDVASGRRLWPAGGGSKKIKVGFEIEDRGEEAAITRLATASAYCTTRYLYNCTKAKFRISEDRTSIGWENW